MWSFIGAYHTTMQIFIMKHPVFIDWMWKNTSLGLETKHISVSRAGDQANLKDISKYVVYKIKINLLWNIIWLTSDIIVDLETL